MIAPPKLINKFLCQFDKHTQELLRGISVAFVLKVLGAGFAFCLNVVLARLLGAEGSGIFFLAFTIVLILATIGRVGMENALVRFIAANLSAKLPGKVLGVYQKAMLYSLVVSTILATLLYILAPWISQTVFAKPELAQSLGIMAIAVIPLALLTLHANALQGLKEIASSISVSSVYVPLITCVVAVIFVPKNGIAAAAWGYLMATTITLLIGRRFWQNAVSSLKANAAEFNRSELLASSMPLFGIVMMNLVIVWSPMMFLGIWENSKNVGIYSAASRTAMLTSFVLIAVNSIAAPKFAALYQRGDLLALGSLARKSAKMMVLLTSPALVLFMLIPELIMSIFGDQFNQGATILMILALGQFVNVATGSVGYLLMMTGNERLMRNNLIFIASLGILLNLILIPNYGILGAAIGASIVLATQNLIAMILVWRKLNIWTLPWIGIIQTNKRF